MRNGKINLSISRRSEPKTMEPVEIDWDLEAKKNQGSNFEDRLAKFLKESDEKLQQLKKNSDSKRSGGYRKSEGLQKV